MKKKDPDVITEEEKKESEQNKEGNKFVKAGKIFLLIILMSLQAMVAYAIVKNNYADIREKIMSMTDKGGYYFQIEDVIVNPSSSDGQRYLIASIAFEFNNKGGLTQAESLKIEILDKVNSHLNKKTVEDLGDLSQRDELKSELRNEINNLFGQKMVRNLFFTKYVIQ
ncbi:MAG: flagellar basal body-associated FliL family protein [Balneolaceae bacterium]